MPSPKTSDERLADLRAVLSEVADPDLRLAIMYAALDYATARACEAIDRAAETWARREAA